MAGGPVRALTVRRVGDVRHHVAHVSHGAGVIMLVVQSALEDVAGAAAAGQWGLVLVQGRQAVLACLHVRGLAAGAGPYAYDDTGAFDPFSEVPEADVARALTLIERARTVREAEVDDWLADVRRFAAETEAGLGLPDPLPHLRSPEGVFGVMRLLREWQPVMDRLGLPPIVPGDWTTRM